MKIEVKELLAKITKIHLQGKAETGWIKINGKMFYEVNTLGQSLLLSDAEYRKAQIRWNRCDANQMKLSMKIRTEIATGETTHI